MTIGNRIKKYISEAYKTQTNFAQSTGVRVAVINRYVNDKALPGADVLIKFKKAGMSIDWLLDGSGTMYANNAVGQQLRKKIENEIEPEPDTPFDRIKVWIRENYSSLENFSLIMNTDHNELFDILYKNSIPGTEFINMMTRAGCNMSWISNGTGEQYADNPAGMLLQIRQGKTENSTMLLKYFEKNHINPNADIDAEKLTRLLKYAVNLRLEDIQNIIDQ